MTERYLTKLYREAFASLTVVGPEWKLPVIRPPSNTLPPAVSNRKHMILTAFGETKEVALWAIQYNIPRKTITDRLRREWPVEKAISHPLQPRGAPERNRNQRQGAQRAHRVPRHGATVSHERMAG